MMLKQYCINKYKKIDTMCSWELYDLLKNKTLLETDGKLFYNTVDKLIEDPEYAFLLLLKEIITRSNLELYYKVIEKSIVNPEHTYWFLSQHIISPEDGEIYIKVVKEKDALDKLYNRNFYKNEKVVQNGSLI